MARLWLITCVMLIVLAAYTGAEEKYSEGRFAHINVDEVLGNRRILVSFIKCFLEQGPCTADGRDIKKLLPEAIDSRCAKCTDNQKKMMAKVIQHVRDNHPAEWEQLVNKYDPDHSKAADVDVFVKEAMAL